MNEEAQKALELNQQETKLVLAKYEGDIDKAITEDFDHFEPSLQKTATDIQEILAQGEFEANKVDKMDVFDEFNKNANI